MHISGKSYRGNVVGLYSGNFATIYGIAMMKRLDWTKSRSLFVDSNLPFLATPSDGLFENNRNLVETKCLLRRLKSCNSGRRNFINKKKIKSCEIIK